jgi:beta-N-acetylhexosaminidase
MSASLAEKIGQMLLIGFRGCQISDRDPIASDIAERNLGGVVLFDQEMADRSIAVRNVKSPEQVAALTASLQSRARTPLLISIDQEGGVVNRLKPIYGFPPTLSHEELGAFDDPSRTFAEAEKIAKMLADAGINLNLAPVVDLDASPENPIIKGKKRSFGSGPELVGRHAMEFARAHHRHGILTCAKHFPGHGSARGDTHLGLVDVTNYWTEKELVPFQRLIESRLCDIVMTAHIFNAHLDATHPATLSKAVIGGLLRGKLGFDGVIFSDDMEMKAISSHYGLEQAIQLAVEAGVDMLCFGNNMNFDANIGQKAASIIGRLVNEGKITEARIEESFRRIQKLKSANFPTVGKYLPLLRD